MAQLIGESLYHSIEPAF